jgi:hypothetical protein
LLLRRLALSTGPGTTRTPSTGLPSSVDERRESIAEFRCVVLGEVYRVVVAVKPEVDSARRLRTVEVVDEPYGRLLCHCALPSIKLGPVESWQHNYDPGPNAQLSSPEIAEKIRLVTLRVSIAGLS